MLENTREADCVAYRNCKHDAMEWCMLIGSRCQMSKEGPDLKALEKTQKEKSSFTFSRRSCRLHGGCFGVGCMRLATQRRPQM